MIYFLVPRNLSRAVAASQIVPMAANIPNQVKTIVFKSNKNFIQTENSLLLKQSLVVMLICNLKSGDVVYTREFDDFLKSLFVKIILRKKIKIIYNFRGLGSEESWGRHRSKIRRSILQVIEGLIYYCADEVVVVSNNFKRYLKHKYGSRKTDVIEMHCSVARNYLKQSFSRGSLRFLYLGGFSVWQKPCEVIEIFKKLKKKYHGSKLTIISYSQPDARLQNLIESNNVEIISLSHENVVQVLPLYDFGFILRDNILMNQVSSPIKFSEYVAMGVVPIISPGVGDFYEVSKRKALAVCTNDHFDFSLDDFEKILNDEKIHERLYEFSKDFLWKNSLRKFPV
ncbi:MAG TPA: hypothetical protein PLY88_00885 [Candidatus Omnitrophota bacterium]|nr:hypothetical protein [Candidatus Omnitrophota bacterium]